MRAAITPTGAPETPFVRFTPVPGNLTPEDRETLLAGLVEVLDAICDGLPPEPPDPREHGLATLRAYVSHHRLTVRKVAALMGCAYGHAARLLRGECRISFEHAWHFQRATGVRAAKVLGLE